MKKIKLNKKAIVISCIVVALIAGTIVFFALNNNQKNNKKENNKKEPVHETKVEEEKKVTIVDLDDKTRPYAVMINNHHESRPQAGLDKAYIIYEFLVEGGITRMMALFTQDVDVDRIGSVRSSRHYYLDYAMENDAVYVHWGTSTYAQRDIASLGIDNIDGMYHGDTYFTTDYSLDRSLEHTRFTSSSLVKNGISRIGYRNTREKPYLLNYTVDEVDLSKKDGSTVNRIDVNYSYYMTANYNYNEEDKMYYRSINDEPMVDLETGKQYKFKNVIVYDLVYRDISSYGHQDIDNIGSGEGYYFTNGKGVKIKWSKSSRGDQTKYYYEDGTEIEFSDGNTFIQIYPTTGSLSFN